MNDLMDRDQNKDAWLITQVFAGTVTIGLVIVAVHQFIVLSDLLAPVLWSLAFLVSGGSIGFLFGIPKILTEATIVQGGTDLVEQQPGRQSGYRPSTHLDKVADWLTTLIVGLTLIQWDRVIASFNSTTAFIARGLSKTTDSCVTTDDCVQSFRPFVASIMVYFAVVGFLGCYLLTRTYLSKVFERGDVGLPIDPGEKSQFNQIDLSDLRSLGQQFGFQQVASKIDQYKLVQLSSLEDITAWAKAQLILKHYESAVEGYKTAVGISPADIQLRLEYTNALYYAGKEISDAVRKTQLRSESEAQLLKAYGLLNLDTDPVTKMKVFRAITFFYLYSAPPEGFANTIKFGTEYVGSSDLRQVPSGGLWVNLACAFGQKFRWLSSHDGSEQDLANARAEALKASNEAIRLDRGGKWRTRLRDLMSADSPDGDLAVFRNDPEFYSLLGLEGPASNL